MADKVKYEPTFIKKSERAAGIEDVVTGSKTEEKKEKPKAKRNWAGVHLPIDPTQLKATMESGFSPVEKVEKREHYKAGNPKKLKCGF
jgi:hypothetical protein